MEKEHLTFSRFLLAGALYLILTVLFTWPMALHFQSAVVGSGDAFMYLWDFWWFQAKIHDLSNLWNCPMVLYPYGANLIQHDFPVWPSLVAFVSEHAGLTPAGSYNASIWLAFWLNALSLFLLTYTVVKQWMPALIAGLVFAFAPYFWGRVQGHLSLMHAYPLAFFALCLNQWQQTRSRRWAFAAGLSLSLATYSSYYYALYALFYVALFLLYHTVSFRLSLIQRMPANRWWRAFFVSGILGAVISVTIIATGGWESSTIRLKGTSNWMILWWASWLIAFLLRYKTRVKVQKREDAIPIHSMIHFGCYLLLALTTITPHLIAAASLLSARDAISEHVGFKAGPSGAYVFSAFVPNVYQTLWRSVIQRKIDLGDLLEFGSIGLGWTCLTCVLMKGVHRERSWWRLVFLVCFALSLGPFLKIAPGLEHGPVLPFWFLRFVPILSGARNPSRWIAAALIAWAVLVAKAFQKIKSNRWRTLVVLGILFESLSLPLNMSSTSVPSIYQTVAADDQKGALLELPFGLHDGRKAWGNPYPATQLFYQTVHQKPIAGGWLSRIPDTIFQEYKNDPVLQQLVDLQDQSSHRHIDPAVFHHWLRNWKIDWIVLDQARSGPALRKEAIRLLHQPNLKQDYLLAWKVGNSWL